MHMEYEKQLAWKKQQVGELLKPYGKLEGMIGMKEPKYYRHKVHAVFGMDGRGNTVSGVYREGTHQIVPVDSCLLENQKADAIIRTVSAKTGGKAAVCVLSFYWRQAVPAPIL